MWKAFCIPGAVLVLEIEWEQNQMELTYYWRRGRQFTKLKYIANQNVISAMGKIKRGRPIGSARRRLCSDFE